MMLLTQDTSQNISLELQNFTQISNNQSVMECLSQFKNHLEDVIENLESVREKNDILKERETSIHNLRNELHATQTKNQNLEMELEQLKYRFEDLNSQRQPSVDPEQVKKLQSEVDRYRKIASEQQDIISNYEEAINHNFDEENMNLEQNINSVANEHTSAMHNFIKTSSQHKKSSTIHGKSTLELLEEKFNASKNFKDRFFNPNKLMKPESSQYQKLHSIQQDPEIENKFIEALEKLKLTDSMNMTLKEEINSITDHNDVLIDENHLLKRKLKKYHTQYQDLTEENQRLIDNFAKIEDELNQMTTRHLKSPKITESEKQVVKQERMLREYEKDLKHLLGRNKRLKRKNTELKEQIFQLTSSSHQSKNSRHSRKNRSSKQMSSMSMYGNFTTEPSKLQDTGSIALDFQDKGSSSNQIKKVVKSLKRRVEHLENEKIGGQKRHSQKDFRKKSGSGVGRHQQFTDKENFNPNLRPKQPQSSKGIMEKFSKAIDKFGEKMEKIKSSLTDEGKSRHLTHN